MSTTTSPSWLPGGRVASVLAMLTLAALLGTACVVPPPPRVLDPGSDVAGVGPNPVDFGSILPIVRETGPVTLSVDGVGTNDPAGGTLEIEKPPGATVRSAYLAAATTGFSMRVLNDGDVELDGVDVSWDLQTPSAIASTNHWADVTSIVAPKLDAAPAGGVPFEVDEVVSSSVEGEILAVVFDDPAQTTTNTVVLLFGAQDVAGDTFDIGLAEPIQPSTERALELSLGISFGFQRAGIPEEFRQFSTVDVNGDRLTSAAGGQDDGADEDGTLLTVGGVGDDPANPADPSAGPGDPGEDDERYDLRPFVTAGDTSIEVFTQNPSNDDNIFFAALTLEGTAAVVGEGIVLGPLTGTDPIGTDHTVTATVQDDEGDPVVGREVVFEVVAGPNATLTGASATGADGKASFTYSSSTTGVDIVEASTSDSSGQPILSNRVRKEWTDDVADSAAPACDLVSVDDTGIDVEVRDSESGLAAVDVVIVENATVTIPPFATGDTTLQAVRADKIDPGLPSRLELEVSDAVGNVTRCDPVLTTVGADGAVQEIGPLPSAEHLVTVRNGSPGLGTLVVDVNGLRYELAGLADGEERTIDVSDAVVPGYGLRYHLTGTGSVDGSALVVIWDGQGSL